MSRLRESEAEGREVELESAEHEEVHRARTQPDEQSPPLFSPLIMTCDVIMIRTQNATSVLKQVSRKRR